MTLYIATLRAFFSTETDVDAEVIAETLREHLEAQLDTEEDDFVVLTQVIQGSNVQDALPHEMCDHLRIARNYLIRTRIKECFDLARELDRVTWALERRDSAHMGDYDWSRFLVTAKQVLDGQNPVD